MANQEWCDRLRQELNKRKLPSPYSARLVDEFTDHLADLQEVSSHMAVVKSAEALLGAPESLAAAAEREFLRRTFSGRHPQLMFLLLPLPVVGLISIVTIYFLFWCQYEVTPTFPVQLVKPTRLEWLVAYSCYYATRFLPFVVTAWVFTALGRRSYRPGWGLSACILIAGFAFLLRVMLLHPSDQHNLVLALTFGPQDGQSVFAWLLNEIKQDRDRLTQAMVPLVIGLCGFVRLPRSFWRRIDNPLSQASPVTR